MSTPTQSMPEPVDKTAIRQSQVALPVLHSDLPILYEDEGQEEMGESTPHTDTDQILTVCLRLHFRPRPLVRVFSNLNFYYHPVDRRAYVSPDVMVVQTAQPLPEILTSYRLAEERPAPLLVIEILSPRSAQQQDLTNKPVIYAALGVAEYILYSTGQMMPDRLLLKRRVDEATWADEQDRDGGVTSRLGFRILIEDDELPRLIETATGRRYLRPFEAEDAVEAARVAAQVAQAAVQAEKEAAKAAQAAVQAEKEARRLAEEQIRQLQAELQRLRGEQPGGGEAR
jgi:Uma2 family endonuclease